LYISSIEELSVSDESEDDSVSTLLMISPLLQECEPELRSVSDDDARSGDRSGDVFGVDEDDVDSPHGRAGGSDGPQAVGEGDWDDDASLDDDLWKRGLRG
jgi:hypothetical protein